MSIIEASCCCNTEPDPCATASSGSSVILTIQYRVATAYKFKEKHCGSCVPCTAAPCPAVDDTNAVAAFGANSFTGIVTVADPACGYLDFTIQELESFDMPEPYIVSIPWAASGYYIGFIAWHVLTTGMRTDFTAPGAQPADTYSGTGPGLRYTQAPEVCGCGSKLTVDTACQPIAASARFGHWWRYSDGPGIYRIKRSTAGSPARRWRVSAGNFEILNTSGTVLVSLALAGRTLDTLRTNLNASSAQISVEWDTATTPNAFSRGLSAELFQEQLNAGAINIPVFNTTPETVRLYRLNGVLQEVPDIPNGQCSSATANVGWTASVGNPGYYNWGNGGSLFRDGICSKAVYRQMCPGVMFEGDYAFVNPSDSPMSTILSCGAFTWSDYASCPGPCIAGSNPQTGWYDCNGETCCGKSCQRIPCSGPWSDSCVNAPVSNPFPNGYWRTVQLGGGPWTGETGSSYTAGDYGANFSECCAVGYECWGYAIKSSNAIKGLVWSQIQRVG